MLRKACFTFCLLTGLMVAGAAPAAADFTYGGALRLRQEYWGRVFNLGTGAPPRASNNFLRLKASLWGRLALGEELSLYLRLTSEPRYYFQHPAGDSSGWSSDELFIDNLYLDWRNVAGLPLDLRLGRQDLLGAYGEGFLVMDGATLAGSRAFYFNAARATWQLADGHALELLYTNNQETDKYLPVINNKGQALNRSGEWATMLYARNAISENLQLDPYFIYKREQTADPLTLKTLGACAVWQADPWRLRGQYARQFGDYGSGRTRRGVGGYLFAERDLAAVALQPRLSGGFAWLSGDDPDVPGRDGAWNPLFSRYPWMGDLYIFTYAPERDIAYWTNLQLYRLGAQLTLAPSTGLAFFYNYLRANEAVSPAHPLYGALFGDGRGRGHLPQLTLNHRFNPSLDGLLQVEHFRPGSFYAPDAGSALFFRWQLQYRF